MPKTNKQYLEEMLTDEQQEWFDGVLKDHQKAMDEKDAEIDNLMIDNDDLQNQLDKANDRQLGTPINTGIGTIRYECEGSLDQVLLMEAIAELIKEQGVKGLLDQVRGTWGV